VMQYVLISSCLLGLQTRYDGSDSFDPLILKLKEDYVLLPVCPELLGGLTIPREPATFEQGDGRAFWEENTRVIQETGGDVTQNFREGALKTVDFARFLKARIIILKDGSPSCGIRKTNVSFQSVCGIGVTAYLLRKNEFDIYTVESFLDHT